MASGLKLFCMLLNASITWYDFTQMMQVSIVDLEVLSCLTVVEFRFRHCFLLLEEKYDEVLCLNRHCCAFGDPSEVLTEDVVEEMYGSHNQILKEHRPGSHGDSNGN